ncbi:MAG: endonuclease/exonuclease/phosphatase family protein [Bacteroidetes bacterium]|nr:MAG: endonuclease/exonuclease/phosphatase family protein [Bacteroidota bacterium]
MKTTLITAFILLTFQITLSAQKDEYKVAAIGFYNLENLFDTLDNPTTRDEDFLPEGRLLWNTERYQSKQTNLAYVISLLGTDITPDGLAILGVAEVENRSVLEDLAVQPALKDRQYQVIHFDSPDERGIDVGLLYQPKYFTPTDSKAVPVQLSEPGAPNADYTRDVLLVSGLFDGEPLHILVNHWPSRSGGENVSAPRRAAAAQVCRNLVDSLTAADADAKIVIMGDLNDDPNNKSVAEVLHAVRSAKKARDGALYNPMYDLYLNGVGTLAYRDAWNLFDQLIISSPLVSKKSGGWQFYKPVVFRKPWMFQEDGAFKGYPLRTFVGDIFLNGYSDHLPVYMLLLKKAEK